MHLQVKTLVSWFSNIFVLGGNHGHNKAPAEYSQMLSFVPSFNKMCLSKALMLKQSRINSGHPGMAKFGGKKQIHTRHQPVRKRAVSWWNTEWSSILSEPRYFRFAKFPYGWHVATVKVLAEFIQDVPWQTAMPSNAIATVPHWI